MRPPKVSSLLCTTPICLFDFLYKTKHTIRKLLVSLFGHFRIVGIGMVAVEKLHDMKPAAVDVKMYIAFLKIRCYGFPNLNLMMQFFNRTPGGIANTFAVNFWRNKQQFEIPSVSINFDDCAANRLSVPHDPISFPFFNGSLNGLPGNDLTIIFEMIISASEFFQCTVIKCFLIIRYELFPIIGSEWYKYYFRHDITS